MVFFKIRQQKGREQHVQKTRVFCHNHVQDSISGIFRFLRPSLFCFSARPLLTFFYLLGFYIISFCFPFLLHSVLQVFSLLTAYTCVSLKINNYPRDALPLRVIQMLEYLGSRYNVHGCQSSPLHRLLIQGELFCQVLRVLMVYH